MFWRKKKPTSVEQTSEIFELATQLGVERRQNVRVRYAPRQSVCKLPEISFRGKKIRVQDISTGGCCLFDFEDHLGAYIGQEVELELHWFTGLESIQAKIVACIDERRHIQFLNLNSNRQASLKRFMGPGIRGLGVRRHASSLARGPVLMALEMWSSVQGDSVVLESDPDRLAQVSFAGERFTVLRSSWPQNSKSQKCSKPEVEQLILFLSNIPSPSPDLLDLRDHLVTQIQGENE